jgi:hypothetical protein
MKYLNALLFDAIQAVLAIAWVHYRLGGAGNAFVAISWALTTIMLVHGLTSLDVGMKTGYGKLWAAYNAVRFGAKVITYAWLGLFWLFGVYLFASMIVSAARNQYKVNQAKTKASA